MNTLHDWAIRHGVTPAGLPGQPHPVFFGTLKFDKREMVSEPTGGPDWLHALIRQELSK